MLRTSLLCILVLALSACAQYENKRGVDVTWQPAVLDGLQKGVTTRHEVLKLLGPPSQLISLDGETVLYYLYERSDGEGLILVLYNRFEVDTRYDRAVFFFDENDRLTDYATHINPAS
jgi:outer membrane protein assembly factor BamE (lipoprotein component of BamABCDE complex)